MDNVFQLEQCVRKQENLFHSAGTGHLLYLCISMGQVALCTSLDMPFSQGWSVSLFFKGTVPLHHSPGLAVCLAGPYFPKQQGVWGSHTFLVLLYFFYWEGRRKGKALYDLRLSRAYPQTKIIITQSYVKTGLFIDGCDLRFSYNYKSCGTMENGVEMIIHVLMHFYFLR